MSRSVAAIAVRNDRRSHPVVDIGLARRAAVSWARSRAVAALILIGGAIVVSSFVRFVMDGLGTPAPVAQPRMLVVTGMYRHVRNPMYVGALSAIFSQALLFGDPRLILCGAIAFLCFHLFVVLYEEPTLRRKFGAQYTDYCRNVPRWIPRVKPWRP